MIVVVIGLYFLTSPFVTSLSASKADRPIKNWYNPDGIHRLDQLGLYVFALLLSQG